MNTENRCHRLYWLCTQSGKKIPAGVAFYNDSKSDYRLKVDTFCEDKNVFVKPVSMENGVINFRVESLVKKKAGAPHRAEIGVGHANLEEGFPIYMEIGPFDRALVMEAAV